MLHLIPHRAHVDRDIEPYVCISEECKDPPHFFVNLRDWKTHMEEKHSLDWARSIHSMTWYCEMDHPDGDSKEFVNKGDFIQHLTATHGGSITRPQILAKARRNKRVIFREPFTCPLCDCCPEEVMQRMREEPYELLSNHIARHLKALAFFSLSQIKYEESSGTDWTSGVFNSTTTHLNSHYEMFDDSHPTTIDNIAVSVDGPRADIISASESPIILQDEFFEVNTGHYKTLKEFIAAVLVSGKKTKAQLTSANHSPGLDYVFCQFQRTKAITQGESVPSDKALLAKPIPPWVPLLNCSLEVRLQLPNLHLMDPSLVLSILTKARQPLFLSILVNGGSLVESLSFNVPPIDPSRVSSIGIGYTNIVNFGSWDIRQDTNWYQIDQQLGNKLTAPVNPLKRKVSAAAQEWSSRKNNGESSSALDELMQYQGLEEVKQYFLDIKSKVDICDKQDPYRKINVLKLERFNAVFQGSPGTGAHAVISSCCVLLRLTYILCKRQDDGRSIIR